MTIDVSELKDMLKNIKMTSENVEDLFYASQKLASVGVFTDISQVMQNNLKLNYYLTISEVSNGI